MSDEHDLDEIDRALAKIHEEAGALISSCTYQTSFNKYGELRDRAKRGGRVIEYVDGTFFQMDQAQYLLDFSTMRERAIELISLLGDFEQLLKIQPDISPDYFDYAVWQMRPCGYENLAAATGMTEGYNSDGLHDCIADGLQVCRSVGKLGCINCFREYACDVYLAADDFELARHQCSTVVSHTGEWQARGNRRWVAQMKVGWINAVSGDFEAALKSYEQALEFTAEEDVSLKLEARFKVLVELDAVRALKSLKPLLPEDDIFAGLPPQGECPYFEMKRDWNTALQAAVARDYGTADALLDDWDNRLRTHKATHYWFENRLRQIALNRLSGDSRAAESLAESVEERAKKANDWLTIRRLNEILGADRDPSPLGVADRSARGGVSGSVPGDDDKLSADDVTKVSDDVEKDLAKYSAGLKEAFETQDAEQIEVAVIEMTRELLQVTPEQAVSYQDTAAYLGVVRTLIGFAVDQSAIPDLWRWANRLCSPHRNNGYILSMLASTGHQLATRIEDTENTLITEDRLRQLFKQSLQLVDDGPGTYCRAGDFYESTGDVGEAERCYARSFKLDRTNGEVAVRLSSLYSDTDRPRDALHVLDLCLREGTDDASVAYQAVRLALELKQYESMVTYLDRLLQFPDTEDKSPLPYFRAIAQLGLGNAADAIIQIDRESAETDGDFHCHVVRACAASKIGDSAVAADSYRKVVDRDLRELDYLPPKDIIFLLQLLWDHVESIAPADSDAEKLRVRLLTLGEMPESWFNLERQRQPAEEELQFYVALISQELPDWASSPHCMPGTEHWDHYLAEWGVLAADEDTAAQYVEEYQRLCGSGELRVLEVTHENGPYNDSPGVTFQGLRKFVPLEMMNFDELE